LQSPLTSSDSRGASIHFADAPRLLPKIDLGLIRIRQRRMGRRWRSAEDIDMHTKATVASATMDIALDKLKRSPDNVRKTGADVGLEEFAASIAAHGLLQPLVVEPERNGEGGETGWYLVTAGERRRKALQMLVKQKRIKRTEPIPCLIKPDGFASEISLAENTIRASMHPADQFEAFQKLHDQGGLGAEEIAARFGVTPAVVRQRLKLAAVSPMLMALYREGELTLDQLMAFTLTDDHRRQEEAWEQLSWNKSPEMIRKLLTQTHVGPSDRRVRFVGPEAYEAAGGTIVRDLFVEDHGGYFTDSQLLDRLVLEKLESAAEEVMREGWKWVVVYPEYPHSYTHNLRRIYPHPVPPSDEEQTKLDELVCAQDTLIAEHGEDASEDAVAELDRLAEQIVAIQRRAESYLPEDISRAGAIVSLSSEGALRVERGFIKPEDERQAADEAQAPDGSKPTRPNPSGYAVKQDGAESESGKPLSNQLMENLTAQRTIALQECLAGKPDVALMAVVHALTLRIFYRKETRSDTCLGLEAKVAEPGTFAPNVNESRAGQALARRHEEWARRMPSDVRELWDWIASQDAETLLALLAYCAARTADAIHRSWERGTGALRHADQLALTVSLDMAEWWAPTRDSYLAHVSKAQILEAVREGVSANDADNIAGLKKDPMIDHAERLLAGRRWLPDVLRIDSRTTALEAVASA
jgi:ParB family transcriptional regulator, chromosome partitioning protein